MQRPDFHPLSGSASWLRCDHDGTWIEPDTETVRLAPADLVDGSARDARIDEDVYTLWRYAWGGAARLPCPPDHCEDAKVLLADPRAEAGAEVQVLGDEGWQPLRRPPTPEPESAHALRFVDSDEGAEERTGLFAAPTSLQRDAVGRIWLLEQGAGRGRIRVLRDDLSPLGRIDPPVRMRVGDAWIDIQLDAMAVTSWGIVAIDTRNGLVLRHPHAGSWEAVELLWAPPHTSLVPDAIPVAVAGGPVGHAVVVLRGVGAESETSHLAVVRQDTAQLMTLEGLEDPLHVLLLPEDRVLVGELDAEATPGWRGLNVFWQYHLHGEGLVFEERFAVRGFDGRGLWRGDDGQVWASTAAGANLLFPLRRRLTTRGRIETFALDSQLGGCAWHRIFLDACLPTGTSLHIWARTDDVLLDERWDEGDTERPRPPAGRQAPEEDEAWRALRLGSRRAEDEEGWVEVGRLDRRAFQIDVPLPPERVERPSDDPLQRKGARRDGPEPVRLETLEGLIKNAPGRYLWLRIELRGTQRRTPVLRALRATFTRPSMLEHLPAYWRADRRAPEMERFLALFEATYTEIDGRIEAFPGILDPRLCPPEVLDWLGTFVALGFDQRLREGVRRQLLLEIASLYRMRGTVPGLERLCTILAEAKVVVVEGFRMRRRDGARLAEEPEEGAEATVSDELGSVLGPGLRLGASQDAGEVATWEQELILRRLLLEQHRAGVGPPPCPAVIEDPLPDADPYYRFHRAFAHRFSVLVFRQCDPIVREILETAIEASKPAHTLHALCFLDAGFRLGANTYLGMGTQLGETECWEPAVVGDDLPIGGRTTVWTHRPERELGIRVGDAALGAGSLGGPRAYEEGDRA